MHEGCVDESPAIYVLVPIFGSPLAPRCCLVTCYGRRTQQTATTILTRAKKKKKKKKHRQFSLGDKKLGKGGGEEQKNLRRNGINSDSRLGLLASCCFCEANDCVFGGAVDGAVGLAD